MRPGLYMGDSLRLRQVLINLLGNAVKFTPECGHIRFAVKATAHEGDKSLFAFSVADSGIGIDAKNLSMLFMPFEQGSGEITQKYGGTGLGLPISQNIVRLFGGEITVESQKNQGSVFSFSIWMQQIEQTVDRADTSSHNTSIAGKRILLVDDVEINRLIVTELLSESGLVIDEAENGQIALQMFEQSPHGYYDLILMDVQMPVMDGYTATQSIRVLPRPDSTLPIVALTANAFKEDEEKAAQCGMNAHLGKPIEYEKMIDLIHDFLSSGE